MAKKRRVGWREGHLLSCWITEWRASDGRDGRLCGDLRKKTSSGYFKDDERPMTLYLEAFAAITFRYMRLRFPALKADICMRWESQWEVLLCLNFHWSVCTHTYSVDTFYPSLSGGIYEVRGERINQRCSQKWDNRIQRWRKRPEGSYVYIPWGKCSLQTWQ